MAIIEFPFSRTTAQRVRGADGYLKEYGVNDPAYEFNSDLTYRGLRFEPLVTNYITQSNNFPDTAWLQTRASWLSGISSVENQNTAYKMRELGGVGVYHGTYQLLTGLTAGTYTWSVFAKKSGDRSRIALMVGVSSSFNGAIFNLDTGLVTSTNDDGGIFDSANIESWVNGWYRVSVTFTITGTLDIYHRMLNAIDDTTFKNYNSTTNYGVYIFGAQGKVGDTAGGYVETGATSASSTAGFISKSGLQDYLGQHNSGGNFYVNFEVQDVKQGFLMSVKNLSNGTRISLFLNTGNTCTVQVVGQTNYSYTVNLVGSKHKIAVSYVVGDQRLAYNGQVVDTQTVNITDNTVLDAVEVGGFAQGVLVPDVNVRGMAFGTETLSNNRLSNLTRL